MLGMYGHFALRQLRHKAGPFRRWQLNHAEKIAEVWLYQQGFKSVEYEPFGVSTFPDFLIDERILVEVTWLIQADEQTGKPLSEEAEPFVSAFEKLLHSLGGPSVGRTYFVDVAFRRPLFQSRKALEVALAGTINSDDLQFDGKTRYYLKPGVWIELYPASRPHAYRYVLGCLIDYDAGGWAGDFVPRSLEAALARKETRASRLLKAQEEREMWLILVDSMGASAADYRDLKLAIGAFSKVIVLGPTGEIASWQKTK